MEKLDAVLTYLKKYKGRKIPINELNSYLQSTRPDDFLLEDINKVLHELISDGCITYIAPGFYQVTLKGIVWLENGGYNSQVTNNVIRTNRRRLFNGQEFSLYPWLWASVALFMLYELLRYGYFNWHWNIPF